MRPLKRRVRAAKADARRERRRRELPPHLAAVDRVKGGITLEEADLLFRLAGQVDGSGCIVEVGSYRGRSTVALAHGAGSTPVFAIEPHEPFKGILGGEFGPEDRAAFFETMLHSKGYERVRLVNLSSEVVTPGWQRPVGLLWIDGDHSYGGVRRDWDAWKPHLAPGAVLAFDDSTDETIGPHRLIGALTEAGELTVIERVGKVTALRRP
ncbi:MAG TPA: class I SAM-dependent methyltransferase [Solirubrobacteraceae bacterium]|nr:class I SAM-dependent methyltransferase [Solirubrobacteraceae bacterium]